MRFGRLSASLADLAEQLKLTHFYSWFSAAVSRWLDIALYKALIRIGKAINMDTLQTVDSLVKHSSSAVDTVTVFYQANSTAAFISCCCLSFVFHKARKIIRFILLKIDKDFLGATRLAGQRRRHGVRNQNNRRWLYSSLNSAPMLLLDWQ